MLLSRALRTSPTGANSSSDRSAVSRKTYFRTLFAVACLAASALLSSAAARAATINYGNFGPVPPGVTFQQVTESSGTDPVPLFGPPDPFSIGLDFDPTSFVATANGGAGDITDGQLNFGISAPVVGISSVSLFESGDFALSGVGTAATQAQAGAFMSITVTHVNGAPVVPFNLPPSNASVGFNLLANPGINQPWSLGLTAPINLPQGQIATRVEVVIDNTLIALSEPGTIAFIAKKDFRISTTPNIPEPATLMLTGLAGVISLAFRRRTV